MKIIPGMYIYANGRAYIVHKVTAKRIYNHLVGWNGNPDEPFTPRDGFENLFVDRQAYQVYPTFVGFKE